MAKAPFVIIFLTLFIGFLMFSGESKGNIGKKRVNKGAVDAYLGRFLTSRMELSCENS